MASRSREAYAHQVRRYVAWLGDRSPVDGDPLADIAVLRGIEGARMKETYRQLALQHGIIAKWECDLLEAHLHILGDSGEVPTTYIRLHIDPS